MTLEMSLIILLFIYSFIITIVVIKMYKNIDTKYSYQREFSETFFERITKLDKKTSDFFDRLLSVVETHQETINIINETIDDIIQTIIETNDKEDDNDNFPTISNN